MKAARAAFSPGKPRAYRAILLGGLIAGALDLTAAFVTSALRGRGPVWVLQAISSGLLGADSYKGGFATAALGVALHFLIATVATAVYYAASRKLKFLVHHAIVCGLLYGVAVYGFMNLIVLRLAFPLKPADAPSVIVTGLIVHMLCVGLPIAVVIRRYSK
ncbi:MAG TPA: hypothetical protein VE262_09270 [Blastocatellia bacterium]|nr:hypothetical protein [Blastocatellia bacterium]